MKNRVSVAWGRLALIAGLAGLAVLLFALLPALAGPHAYYEGWQVFFADDFESTFPGDWDVYDESGADGGEYLWGTTAYTFTSADTSVWAVGGGANGSLLNPSTDTYPNNVDSWLVYGPLDLSYAFDARLEFDWFLDSAPGDWFSWCATTDVSGLPTSCQAAAVSGRVGTWVSGTLSLRPYALQDDVWIVFRFTSNDDGVAGLGAFVDNVRVYADYGYRIALPVVIWEPTPTPTPTPTPRPIYFDDFSDPNSGWPRVETQIPGTTSYYRLRYQDGIYRIMLDQGGPLTWFYQPDALAPYRPSSDKYCIEVDVLVVRGEDPYQEWNFYPYWANGGLIFGANEGNTHLYALCLAVGAERGSSADFGWFLVNNPTYEYPRKGCNYLPGVIPGEAVGLDITRWQHLEVGVDGDKVVVFINGVYRGDWTMAGLSAMTRVGLVAGDYEVTPVDFRFDNFRVEPNVNCTP